MNALEQAETWLAESLDDGGRALLRHAGVGKSWKQALLQLPPMLYTKQIPEEGQGLFLLRRLRDYYNKVKNMRAAVAFTRALISLKGDVYGDNHVEVLVETGALGGLLLRQGRMDEAGESLLSAWNGLRSGVGGRDRRLAVVCTNLGLWHLKRDDVEKAERVFDQAYRITKRVAPDAIAIPAARLGEIRLRLGDIDGALPMLRETWNAHIDQFGELDPRTVARARTLAKYLNHKQLFRESAPVLRNIYAYNKKNGTKDQVAQVAFDLAVALNHTWKKEEALRHMEEAIRLTREMSEPGKPHPALPHRVTEYAKVMLERKRVELAEGLFREALEAERYLFGENSPEVGGRLAALGFFCVRSNRKDEATGWLDAAASILRSSVGDEDPRTQKVVGQLVELLFSQAERARKGKDYKLCRELLKRAEALAVPVLGGDSHMVGKIRTLKNMPLGA